MSTIAIWFERRFDFTFPAELLPNLLARLRGTPARLDEALRNRPHSIITAQPASPARPLWSAQEHAGHLLDLEQLWLADPLRELRMSQRHEVAHAVPEVTVVDAEPVVARGDLGCEDRALHVLLEIG